MPGQASDSLQAAAPLAPVGRRACWSGLISCFRAETIKWRRSWALLAAILVPVTQLVFILPIFWVSIFWVNRQGPGFLVWYQVNYTVWNIVFMPIAVAMIAVLSWGLEEESGTWKHLLLQPVGRSLHFLVKCFSHAALLLLSHLLLLAFVAGGGLLLRQVSPDLAMGFFTGRLLLELAAASVLASLPVAGIHTWLSTRFPGLGVGLMLALGGSWFTLLSAQWVPHIWLSPWGAASQVVPMVQRGAGSGWVLLGGGLATGLVMAGLGLLDFHHREEPGK